VTSNDPEGHRGNPRQNVKDGWRSSREKEKKKTKGKKEKEKKMQGLQK
jgi:hypothetical protein